MKIAYINRLVVSIQIFKDVLNVKIVTVVGARPQFIKSAPISKYINTEACIEEIIIHTGQHYDKNMSGIFFEELGIPEPRYNLGVGSGSHGKQTAKMLEGIEDVLLQEKPDGLLVYGDTNSTLAGALAASKLHIPVIHIEAGLRSYNKLMPEEQNRVLTDHISDLLFCPTDTAVKNLLKEGIQKNVYNVGDVMFDSLLINKQIAENRLNLEQCLGLLELNQEIQQSVKNLRNINEQCYYLATIHRAENTDDLSKLNIILETFEELDSPVLFLAHPRTVGLIIKHFNDRYFKNTCFIKPVSYLNMLILSSKSKKILTDSGGLQKEAYFLRRQCITLRDQTEWIETLHGNWNTLCSIDKSHILEVAQNIVPDYNVLSRNYFGDGHAYEKIVNLMKEHF